MIKLRPYQQEVVDTIKEQFLNTNKQYIEMPTGAGKTVTFLSYAKENHFRILILVPTKELLNQVYESALLFFGKKEISRKGNGFYESPSKVHICIINSLRGEYFEEIVAQVFDLIIIDEAHHAMAPSYKRFIKSVEHLWSLKPKSGQKELGKIFGFPTRFLGVTATPDRKDGQLLDDILNKCSKKITINELIDEKWLSDIEGYRVKTNIDLSEVDDHNGDFSLLQLYKKLCVKSRNEMIINVCKKEMKNRKCLIFCINVEHSKMISKLLNESGTSASHIDGRMDSKTRSSILNAFRAGEISTLCNCQLLSEGFDEPSIDGIILARPTRSRSLFLQMIGRGLRISPGKKECKIIDVVDNHKGLANFNCIFLEDTYNHYPILESFKNKNELLEHIQKEQIKVTEFTIEKTNFLKEYVYDSLPATDSMIQYLEENNVKFFHPVSFDEGSFLVWKNELKKEYKKWLQSKKGKIAKEIHHLQS